MTTYKKIAVVGGGPAGLAAAYEFLNTKNGGQNAFSEVVVFEQKDRVGGVWAADRDADFLTDELFKSEYWDASEVHPVLSPPGDLKDHAVDRPLISPAVSSDTQWRRSGVYPNLHTNVPKRFMRFSHIPFKPQEAKSVIHPLITSAEVSQVLETFADENDLKSVIRFNTQVQGVQKDGAKWILTLRCTNGDKDEWYCEEFDAVALASGHYATPYVPKVAGLETRDAGSVSHSKSFRSSESFKGQTVLVVGSSLSGMDIVQYLEPIADVIISRTPGKEEIFPWLTKAAEASKTKPRIEKIDGKHVTFVDGSSSDVDHIIFATGYHWHWPYLNNKFISLTKYGPTGTSTSGSRVGGLYWNIFNIEDSSLGFVGVTLGTLKFHSLEAAAAALAGVWSGQRSLPAKDDQYRWEIERLNATADNALFHFYHYSSFKKEWFDPVIQQFAVKGRLNPIDGEDISDVDKALESAERVYYGVKSGGAEYHDLSI